MIRILFLSVAIIGFILTACASEKQLEIPLKNPLAIQRVDEQVMFSVTDLMKKDSQFDLINFSLWDDKKEIAYQIEELSNGEKIILSVMNFEPNEQKIISVKYGEGVQASEFTPRTYAELAMKPGNVFYDKRYRGDRFENVTNIKVPDNHTDHNALFKYEGPGWESEIIGYRFYIDWRNATDIFGKKISGLVLKNVGVTDTVAADDSYHSMQDWGMDIFKVGNTLGIGSIGMMNEGKVYRVEERDSVFCKIFNGNVFSSVETKYTGWKVGDKKYNLVSTLSISAGSRFTKNEMVVEENPDNLATGLAKYAGCNFTIGKSEQGWNYISLWGKQTLNDDNLGIAILYPVASLKEITEDEINHIVVLEPKDGKVKYFFGAAWEKEPNAIKTETEFLKMLDETINKLNNPIVHER